VDLLGELYDREPRLPEDMPPPTLANTSISVAHMKKNKNVKMVTPIFDHFPENILFPPSGDSRFFWKVIVKDIC
jgi:hypothetical protein